VRHPPGIEKPEKEDVMSQVQPALRAVAPSPSTPTEANKAVVRRWVAEGWNKGDLGCIAELYAADFVQHDPNGPPVVGAPALKAYVAAYRTAFPDIAFTIESLVAEDDMVVWRFNSHATHTGPLMAIPPTGKAGNVTGMVQFRFSGGKIVEVWVNLDALGLFQQLGVIPAMA
jgi:steroid delta-isomerase-like uncharacterized protein